MFVGLACQEEGKKEDINSYDAAWSLFVLFYHVLILG